jgi:hypothetical protein
LWEPIENWITMLKKKEKKSSRLPCIVWLYTLTLPNWLDYPELNWWPSIYVTEHMCTVVCWSHLAKNLSITNSFFIWQSHPLYTTFWFFPKFWYPTSIIYEIRHKRKRNREITGWKRNWNPLGMLTHMWGEKKERVIFFFGSRDPLDECWERGGGELIMVVYSKISVFI